MALASGELPPSAPSTQRRAEGAFRPKTPRDPADARRPLGDAEVLFAFDEFLYHGEVRDFVRAQHSFERISSSLGTDDFDSLIPPCLEVLEFSNHFIRNDTLLCLMYISLGCTLCDGPAEALGPAMRGNIAVLARHDAMPMLVRSLDFLLGHDSSQVLEEGMLEREFRLVLNCIYLQLLFHRHEESFIGGLEMGQGRLGASLVSLLFEATKMCSESDKIPIKKVVLLLLAVLRCLLAVPDEALVPSAGAEQATSAAKVGSVSFPDLQDAAALAASAPSKPPRLRDFQAFAALHLHERGVRQKYGTPGRPAAIEEGLAIIQRYEDEFMKSYSFHPSEVTFMQTSDFLQASVSSDQGETAGVPTVGDGTILEPAPPWMVNIVGPQDAGLFKRRMMEEGVTSSKQLAALMIHGGWNPDGLKDMTREGKKGVLLYSQTARDLYKQGGTFKQEVDAFFD